MQKIMMPAKPLCDHAEGFESALRARELDVGEWALASGTPLADAVKFTAIMKMAPNLLRNSLQLGTIANSIALRTVLLQWCYSSRNFGVSPTVSAGNGTGADDDNKMQVDSLKMGKEKGKGKHQNQKGTRTHNINNTDINICDNCGRTGHWVKDCWRPSGGAYDDNNSSNNNNTIWGGSVLTGEEPPRHSGELSHALSHEGGPTQSQLSAPYVVRTPHLHGALTTEETSTVKPRYKCFWENTRKKKRRNIFRRKKRKKKREMKNMTVGSPSNVPFLNSCQVRPNEFNFHKEIDKFYNWNFSTIFPVSASARTTGKRKKRRRNKEKEKKIKNRKRR